MTTMNEQAEPVDPNEQWRVTLLRFLPPRNCMFGDLDDVVAAIREKSGCWVDWHVAGAHGESAAICCHQQNLRRVGMALLKTVSDIARPHAISQEMGGMNDQTFSVASEASALGAAELRPL